MIGKIFAGLKSFDGAQYRETCEFPTTADAANYAYGLACLDFNEQFEHYWDNGLGNQYLKEALAAHVPEDEDEDIFFEELMNKIINDKRDQEIDHFVEVIES